MIESKKIKIKKLDRWGKNRPHGFQVERGINNPGPENPSNPGSCPRVDAECQQINHNPARVHRNLDATAPTSTARVIFLGEYPKFCPHQGSNSGRLAEASRA